jgi:nucleotide-binding universal stress UspA family protein
MMYKKMLVPLDGSELAEVVLPYARELAGRLNLEFVLLHVCEQHRSGSRFICESYINHLAEMVQMQSREVQNKVNTQSVAAVTARAEVVDGYPADEILNYAERNAIDLILMATHGSSGVKRWVLGSVADKVLRKSKNPIWLVRADVPEEIVHDEWTERKMLVPLDGSKFAEAVLPHVETLARQRGAELMNIILLRAVEEPFVTADYPFPDWDSHIKKMRDYFKEGAEQYLVKIQKRLADGGLNVRTEILMGKPEEEIIKFAQEKHPNLVVMATHGSSGVSLWEYGNVADKILHGISSPIFLIRPQ